MTLITGVLIPADVFKEVALVEFDRDDYAQLSQYIGGDFQCVYLTEATIFCNENGKHMGMPTNERATQFLYDERPEFINRDVLVGDVLILGGADDEGNSLSAPDQIAERLVSA